MKKISNIENPDVLEVFNTYPRSIREKLLRLRELILITALEMEITTPLEETLKWREPSYLTKNGSTIRLGWKKSKPDQYALYFNCNTRLVDSFKELYSDLFTFVGNRAIVFNQFDAIPVEELKHCISLALSYHDIKHLPQLGI